MLFLRTHQILSGTPPFLSGFSPEIAEGHFFYAFIIFLDFIAIFFTFESFGLFLWDTQNFYFDELHTF